MVFIIVTAIYCYKLPLCIYILSIFTVCVLNLNLQLGVLYLVNVLGQYLSALGLCSQLVNLV